MSARRRQIAVAALALALLGATAPAAAATSADVTYSSRTPGATTDVHVRIDYESKDASGHPRALRKHTFTFPPGTEFDPAGAAVCQASAAELRSQGLSACPAESKVGEGSLYAVMTKPPGSMTGSLHTDLTFFNASHPKDAPGVEHAFLVPVSAGGQVQTVNLMVVDGNVLTEEPAMVCANPSEQPPCPSGEFTVKNVDYELSGRMREARGALHRLLTTPPICPSEQTWQFEHLMEYRDGTSARTSEVTPCIFTMPQRIAVQTSPASVRRCRATRFVFSAVTSGGPVAGASVRFANRRALTDGQGRAAIPARICVPGQRRVVVKADGFRKGVASVRVFP